MDDAGQPLTNALVEATPLDPEDQPRFEQTSRAVLTTADGAFRIPGLAEGRYLVTLRDGSGVEIGSGVAGTVAPALIRAEVTGAISGRLLASDGDLSPPLTLKVERDDGAITRRVLVDDVAAPWHLEGLRPGHYTVEAGSANGWRGSAAVVIGGPEPVRVDVILVPPP